VRFHSRTRPVLRPKDTEGLPEAVLSHRGSRASPSDRLPTRRRGRNGEWEDERKQTQQSFIQCLDPQ